MPDVFAVLGQDHQEVKQMLTELENGPAKATGATGDQLHERKTRVQALVIAESKHEAVEEEYFWPAVRDAVPGGDQLADEGTTQEQEAKVVLDRLDRLDPADGAFEELVETIIRDGRRHIAYEEEQVWPPLREALTPTGAEQLGEQLLRAKDLAPTRPHPEIPPRPGILKAGGPIVTATDKIRDAVTHRGKD
jgi:hemerythrin superfamily protein